MENLINNLPQILEKAGSLFGIFALLAIVIAVIAFLLFNKAEPNQKEKIFFYMVLFFLALILSTLAAGFLTGFKGGGEVVSTQRENDPSQVSLSPNTVAKLESYIKSKGQTVTREAKTRFLEESIESYVNPKPTPSPVSNASPTTQPTISLTPSATASPKTQYEDNRFRASAIGASFDKSDRASASIIIENIGTKDILLAYEYGSVNVISDSGKSAVCDFAGINYVYVVNLPEKKDPLLFSRLSPKAKVSASASNCAGIDPLKTNTLSVNVPLVLLEDDKYIKLTIDFSGIPIRK